MSSKSSGAILEVPDINAGAMDSSSYAVLDPYEQQLRKVFDSHDFDGRGSLDRDGLLQLCYTLQLEDQGIDLVRRLLRDDDKSSRINFDEFKDALLMLLDGLQNNGRNGGGEGIEDNKSVDGSPDREVSPKYVYGSKKYGRRSRPRNNDSFLLEELDESNDDDTNYSSKLVAVQRSNSQNDVCCMKKRKTSNVKLKRCTSFPGSHEFGKMSGSFVTTNGLSNDEEIVCTEEMLRKAWQKLGVGKDGYLNQSELVLVCNSIGFQQLAKGVIRQLSNKSVLNADYKISFQELLEALQHDETWLEVLSPTPNHTLNETTITSDCTITESIFPDDSNKTSPLISLGPDGTGYISVDMVSDLWETVGISSPKLLLQELGFVTNQISVSELSATLEREVKSINEAKINLTNPLLVLLQAISELYKTEIRCLKNLVEQSHAEREKLKNDVFEANNRAIMLAQEVDDNHYRMEQNTQNQVKLLEQKHCDTTKELTQQFVSEKEHLLKLNYALEQRIGVLESAESKLNADLRAIQEYLSSVEKENQILSGQVLELRQHKDVLAEQVNILENEKHNLEIENQQVQIEPLLQKLTSLQIENSQLRDRNDEMITEIESLNGQINALRSKASSTPTAFNNFEQSVEENISVICDAISQGSKRRSDESPSKDLNILGLGVSSPRLGKVRRCHKTTTTTRADFLDLPAVSAESGFDAEFDAADSSLSVSINECEELHRLQTRIMHLEELLRKHSISIPSSSFNDNLSDSENVSDDIKIKRLTLRCNELQNILLSVQADIQKALSEGTKHTFDLSSFIGNLQEKLSGNNILSVTNALCAEVATETDTLCEAQLEEQIQNHVRKNEELVTKCSELENCLELLRTEYERCEDYWASKLDEERQMFEQEQNQSSEKLSELIAKIAEYDAQFGQQDESSYTRLPPIEETYNLEKQFTDLEQEFEEYKDGSERQLAEKSRQVVELGEKLNEMQNVSRFNAATQTDYLEDRMSSLSRFVESSNLFAADTMPPIENTLQVGQGTLSSESSFSVPSLHSVSLDSTDNVTPSRPKRTRKHEKSLRPQRLHKAADVVPRVNGGTDISVGWNVADGSRVDGQPITVPITVLHNLNGRLHHLEQKCRHLQIILKQQHYHAEQMLQHCYHQHRGEKAELQYLLKNSQEKLEYQMRICNEQLERLSKTDVLVKDLYVENSYLVANVQRLEKQCHILSQFNAASSSV